MCRQHLLGEHVETHMFAGAFRKGVKAGRFVTENLLEFRSLKARHDELVREMERRGMKHKSEWVEPGPCHQITNAEKAAKIDREAALAELLRRCPECNANYTTLFPSK
jgi:hypothetical protein